MENALARKNDLAISKRVDDQEWYWFPIMMEIVSRQEMELATAEEVQVYNELAYRKYKLMHGGLTMSNETIITTKLSVTGLDQLEKANALMEKLKSATAGLSSGGGSGPSFATKMNAEVEKATVSVKKLSESVKGVSETVGRTSSFSTMTEGINKSVSGSEKLNSSLKESVSLTDRLSSANEKVASTQSKSASSIEKMAAAQSKAVNEAPKMSSSVSSFSEASAKAEGSWSKIGGAIKDSFAMFSVGMLGMTAVNSAIEGIKNAFKGGYESIKEQQAGAAMWATSIQDAHPNVSGKALTKQSKQASDATMQTAIKAGNSYEEANAISKQIYSSSAGSYSGNVNKTQDMLRGMFNIQDANALSEREMLQFRTAVGNIGDLGKVTGNSMKSLNLLDGKIGQSIRKEYKRRNGKELGKTKTGNYDWGQVDAETAFAGIDRFGNSGGLAKASERFNGTIGGVSRASKEGTKYIAGRFIQSFADNINKSMGGKNGLLGGLNNFFTSQDKMKKTADQFANSLAKVADTIGKIGKEAADVGKDIAPYAKQFTSGFAKGFISEIKVIAKGTKDAYEYVKGLGTKFAKFLPDGKIKNGLSNIGQYTGKVTAFLVALRGFSKLPGMAGVVSKIVSPLSKVLGKIPVVGKTLSGFVTKLTGIKPKQDIAGNKMNTAADKMNAAADKMNSASGTASKLSKAGLDENGLVTSDYATRGEYQAALRNSRRAPRFGEKLMMKGETLLGAEGSRIAANKGWFTKLKGNSLIKLGGISESISTSLIGRMAGGAAKGIGSAGRFIGKGMPMMNAAFAGIDAMSAVNSTKSGSLARHQKVGGAIGTGVGSTLGMALGTLADPFTFGMGTFAGGALGGWLGGKAGEWFGGKTGGSKPRVAKAKKPGKSATDFQAEAEYNRQLNEQAQTISDGHGAWNAKSAKKEIRAVASAQGTKSKSAQKHAAAANAAYDNGDFAAYGKESVKAAAETAKYYSNTAKSASKKAKSDKESYETAKSQAKAAKKRFNTRGTGLDRVAYEKAQKKADSAKKKYQKSNKKANSLSKKASKSEKASVALGNKAISDTKKATKETKKHKKVVDKSTKASQKHKKAIDKTGDSATKANKKISKSNKDTEKSNKKTSKSFSKLTKSQKKELDKQTKNLKSANKKKDAQVKSANKKVKAAQQKAAKDIAKADKAASKSMSKNYKTASKQISKAIKSGMKTAANSAKSGSKKIAKNVKSGLKNVGKDTKSAFKKVTSSVKAGMKPAQASAKSGAKKISTNIKSGLKGVGKGTKASFKSLTSSVKSGMKSAQSAAKSGSKSVVSAVKSGLSKVGSAGKSGFSKLNASAKSGMDKVNSSVKSGANKMSGAIKSGMSKANSTMSSAFNKMVSTANSATSRIAKSMDKIGTSATSAASKVKSLQTAINGLKSKTVTITANVKGKGSSKLATGTPGASSAFDHLATGTPSFDAPTHLAQGWAANGGTKAGMYVVNDAKGGRWREAFKLKNGLFGLFPNKRDLRVPLPEGTQVLNGDDTHKMFPHLATGTPGAKGAVPRQKNAGSSGSPIINITINMTGGAKNEAQNIANAIGEKLNQIFPLAEI
ncbi:hypothetical protein CG419_04000 [Latilactobacillus curvatus]|uniref:Uncharacterized protein n=1 Tax=Latilactobacillus curvatus TaxID=28038 RepID=A0AAC9Y0P3_LATCU|nr:hypothetical protein [Latilactobacillus curvatus]ASN59837.1 hypothetical protein CG419_04000 [Latilactobacillus curvatus]